MKQIHSHSSKQLHFYSERRAASVEGPTRRSAASQIGNYDSLRRQSMQIGGQLLYVPNRTAKVDYPNDLI